MNANELADYVLNVIMCVEDFEGERFEKISTMLRTIPALQAEIEELKILFDKTLNNWAKDMERRK